ncbi:MAG: penicillin-binding protein 2 [Actinobacteria bacterium]|nr:penicillin-binding protein 2 [Actinomycetota bacterium]
MTRARGSVPNRRIRLLLAVLVLMFALAFGRTVWLQGIRAEPLARLAESQHRQTVALPASRGAIYDRTGVQLAIGERATSVYADPRQVRNPRAVAIAAGQLLGRDPDDVLEELADRRRSFVFLRRKADPAAADAVRRRGLVGVGFLDEERRAYPQGSIAAHVLGYAGLDNDGLAGLEKQLDPVLAGVPGSETIVKDPFGRAVKVIRSTPEQNGRDVHLTLDQNLQANAELVLAKVLRESRAKSATAVVLDPRSGELLALAVAPTFDANRFGELAAQRTRNLTVTDTYEPGSTFKLITVGAVLSEGLATPATAYTLPYEIQVADRKIHDSHPRDTERMTVAEILSRSSNVGTVTLGQELGKRRLARWIEHFGFGRPTGIDFPGETRGIVLPAERWSDSSIGNIPIGQGIAVTPVQMAAAYAAVANRGVWVRPHLVRRIGRGPRVRGARKRLVSRDVAAKLVEMLRGVVDEGGTGTAAAVPGYTVAGKTGTASKPDERGGYSTSRYVASFVGVVPASDPRLVILVTIDEPRSAIWGGVVAAPVFADLARFALQYLEVPPDAR